MKEELSKFLGCAALLVSLIVLSFGAARAEDPDSTKIDEAIRRGMEYLIRMQRIDGTWNNYSPGNNIGQTALCALALRKAGLDRDHPAILKALNYLSHHSPKRTYDLAVLLALLEAVGPQGREDWIERCASMLLDTQISHLWAYPTGAVDMSNTQYAALGLHAASSCGFKKGLKVWKDLLKGVTSEQAEDGGWGYHRNSNPTGAMTCAGLTCLYVCQLELGKEAGRKGLTGTSRTALERGLAWMDQHFRADRNPRPYENPKNYRWTYYYLYGVERVGSLSGRRCFGEHDWYKEGAQWLLRKQNKKEGRWSSAYGESEMNTAFALLYLSRATSSVYTKVSREHLLVSEIGEEDEKKDIVIACNRKNPGFLWIDSWSDEVAEKYGIDGGAKRIRVEKVEYLSNDDPLGTVEEETSGGVATRFALPYHFTENGDHEFFARVTCRSEDGMQEATFESGGIKLFVHNVLTERDQVYMEDVGTNLIGKSEVHVTTSSAWDHNWRGSRAVDGLQGTGWLSAKVEEDGAPWIKLDMDDPIRANRLKVSHTMAHHFDKGHYGRATQILVVINRGAQKFKAPLGPEENVKYEMSFKTTRIREIRIEVLKKVEGHRHTASGFAEIELFYIPAE